MAKFITNIQLQDANRSDYDALFTELKKELFKNEEHEVKRDSFSGGKELISVEGNVTLLDVNNAVFKASSKTGKKFLYKTFNFWD
jgi:hypothetical protein